MARGHYLQQEVATVAEIVLEEVKNSGPITAHELAQKLGANTTHVSRALAHLAHHGKLAKEGIKGSKNLRYVYVNGAATPTHKPKAALVPHACVEVPKAVLKLLVHDIVDRGETLSPELQRATFKAMSVLI